MRTSQQRNTRQRKSAFTLVELLVVIGIIAALVAMLLPALGKARAQANAVKCASNLRQFGIYYTMYGDNNKGWMPITRTYGGPGNSIHPHWYEFVSMYMSPTMNAFNEQVYGPQPLNWNKWEGYTWVGPFELGIYNCPTNNNQQWRGGMGANLDRESSYTINSWDSESFRIDANMEENRFCGNRRTRFRWTAEMYVMWDAKYYASDPWYDDGSGAFPDYFGPKGLRNMRYQHNKGVNMLFADGHVARLGGPVRGRGTTISADDGHAASYTNGRPFYAN